MRAGVVALGGVLALCGLIISGMSIPIAHFIEIPFLGPVQVGTTYIGLSGIGFLVFAVGIMVFVVGIVIPGEAAEVA